MSKVSSQEKYLMFHDFRRLVEYWEKAKDYGNPQTFYEVGKVEVVSDLYRYMNSEECKTLEDLKAKIAVTLTSMNPG